jgi:hypothetical protein
MTQDMADRIENYRKRMSIRADGAKVTTAEAMRRLILRALKEAEGRADEQPEP